MRTFTTIAILLICGTNIASADAVIQALPEIDVVGLQQLEIAKYQQAWMEQWLYRMELSALIEHHCSSDAKSTDTICQRYVDLQQQ